MNHKLQDARGLIVGRIDYMNVAPVYYGMDDGMLPADCTEIRGTPAELNRMMKHGRIDISPVSSAAYARHHNDWMVLPDLSIGCCGPVLSVLLASRVPFEQLGNKTIILTRDSAAAAALLKLLFRIHGLTPRFITGEVKTPSMIPPEVDAALVIGDAALRHNWQDRFSHVRDLGIMWFDLTGLPFVFAVWAVRKSLAESRPEKVRAITTAFHKSRAAGMHHIQAIASRASAALGIDETISRDYYRRLNYNLGASQRKGLETFFAMLYREKLIAEPVRLSVFSDPGVLETDGYFHTELERNRYSEQVSVGMG